VVVVATTDSARVPSVGVVDPPGERTAPMPWASGWAKADDADSAGATPTAVHTAAIAAMVAVRRTRVRLVPMRNPRPDDISGQLRHRRPHHWTVPPNGLAVIVGRKQRRGSDLRRDAILEPAPASVFGEFAAREAAGHWGYGPDARLELLCVSENATYLVRHPRAGEPAVLRLNRPGYHGYDALVSELAWTAALREADVVSTPRWIPTLTGEPLARLTPGRGDEPRHAAMFGYARGAHPEDDPAAGIAELVQIGDIAARLHAHARSWRPPAGFRRFSWDLAAALGDGAGQLGRWGDWRTDLAVGESRVVERAESQLRQALSAYGYTPSRYGLIHADLRAANLLSEGAGGESRVTVIDFDDCGYSWFLYDLAASVSFLEHRRELPELIGSWLEGYRKTATVGAADLAVVPSLVMLRRLQLQAWASSHADTEMVRSLGPAFTAGTVEVAGRYLSARLLDGIC
jgi:Ser/Thr protein kinase RdoA (MazF antagonist)